MSKGERISQLVEKLLGQDVDLAQSETAQHPFYRAYFQCWNERRYYEAHDVLEQLWIKTDSPDADFFKGLIQAAGGFVHLQKNFEQPSHPKHSRRLQPAVRLLRLAEKNLSTFTPRHHGFDVGALCRLLHEHAEQIVASDYQTNPWSPETAPKLLLLLGRRAAPTGRSEPDWHGSAAALPGENQFAAGDREHERQQD